MALDPKLTKFTTASPIIVSFDSVDFADGTGVVRFFGSDTDDNGTVTYQLARSSIYSANLLTVGTGNVGNEEIILDIDFDVTFNLPKDIKGNLIANMPVIISHESTAGNQGELYIIVKIKRLKVAFLI